MEAEPPFSVKGSESSDNASLRGCSFSSGGAIDAIRTWQARLAKQNAVSFVPIIGHLECRAICMERLRAQPAQLRP